MSLKQEVIDVVLDFVEFVMEVVGEQREKDLVADCGRRRAEYVTVSF